MRFKWVLSLCLEMLVKARVLHVLGKKEEEGERLHFVACAAEVCLLRRLGVYLHKWMMLMCVRAAPAVSGLFPSAPLGGYSTGLSNGARNALIRSSLIFTTHTASDGLMGSAYATKLAAINPERRLHFMSSELLFTHSIAWDCSLLFLSWADQGPPN